MYTDESMNADTNTERPTARHPEVQKRYDEDRHKLKEQYGDDVPCALCHVENHRLINAAKTMLVVENMYPYEFYDGRVIKDHYMIVPKRHVNSLTDFTRRERKDYWYLLCKYQDSGYASLTRPNGDTKRSVPHHLHTHLISFVD